jgi:predicted Abi (CAAX) family protease
VFAKVRSALVTLPNRRGWLETFILFIVFAVIAIPVASSSYLLNPAIPITVWLPLVFTTFFIPALLEEFIWRVLLVPRPGSKYFWLVGFVTLFFYVVSHPVSAWLFRPTARDVFYHPAFLLLATFLGLVCLTAYRRTKSLWPSVVIHWLVVAIWLLFGARILLEA